MLEYTFTFSTHNKTLCDNFVAKLESLNYGRGQVFRKVFNPSRRANAARAEYITTYTIQFHTYNWTRFNSLVPRLVRNYHVGYLGMSLSEEETNVVLQ